MERVVALLHVQSWKCNFMKRTAGGSFPLLLFLLLLAFSGARAQTYPVQATTLLVPPFSGYLQDQVSSQKLKVLLMLNDFSKPAYNVKIKFRLTGQNISIRSKPYYFYGPVTLLPGVPLELSGDDLAQLLADNNLDFSGISYTDYQQHKTLPEGFYTFCFTAYDHDNPLSIPVSQEACAFAWMTYCDPPLLNFPMCNSILPVSVNSGGLPNGPQQVTFSWTSSSAGCPSSLSNTEYIFELYEIFPNGQNPNNIIQTTTPVYTVVTQSTLLNYGITEPPLQLGRSYCWRVKARDVNGSDFFKNEGWSSVCQFTYGSTTGLLGSMIDLQLNAQVIRHNAAKLYWSPNSVFPAYRVEYRKTGNPGYAWFGNTTSQSALVACDLEAQTQYEARLCGIFSGGDSSEWCDAILFTTPAQAPVNCNDQSPAPSMQNFSPLTTLQPNTKLQIGQFELRVTALQSTASASGMYSGAGHITLLGAVNIHVTFSNIMVGSDYVVYQGEVKAVSEGIQQWLSQQGAGMFVHQQYGGTIDSTWVQNGQIVIVSTTGDTSYVTPAEFPYTIQDEQGNTYTYNSDGSITYSMQPPHIVMNEAEKNIYVLALKKLQMDYQKTRVQELKQEFDQKKQENNQQILQGYGITAPASAGNADPFLVCSFRQLKNDSAFAVPSYEKSKIIAEINYLDALVKRRLGGKIPDTKDLDLYGNFLMINEKKSIEYIRERLQAGAAVEEIAQVVKEKLDSFITNTLLKYRYEN